MKERDKLREKLSACTGPLPSQGGGGGAEDEAAGRVLLPGLLPPAGRSRGRAEGLLGLKEGVVRLSHTMGGTREKIAIQYYNVDMSLYSISTILRDDRDGLEGGVNGQLSLSAPSPMQRFFPDSPHHNIYGLTPQV